MSFELAKCRQCDRALDADVKFCPRCGTAVDAKYADTSSDPSAESLIARFGEDKSQPEFIAPVVVPAPTAGTAIATAQAKPEAATAPESDSVPQPASQTVTATATKATSVREGFLSKINSQPAPSDEDITFVLPEGEPVRWLRLPGFLRSPGFDPGRVKKSLLVLGTIVIAVGLFLALDERNKRMRERQQAQAIQEAMTQPLPIITPVLEASPGATPGNPTDSTIVDSIRAALTAYNAQGATMRYKFEVKEGAVTLSGDVFSPTEKSSVENIVRQIAGIKTITNNMVIKADTVAVIPQVQLNSAEAKRLDDALLTQLAEEQKRAEAALAQTQTEPPPAAPQAAPTPDAQREAERLRREQELAKLREEEIALRKQMEERLQREAEDLKRRQEEQRAEAARRTRAELPRADAGVLRSGTVAWSGIVEGADEIIISGSSASVRHLSGEAARETRASFSAPVPRSPVSVKLLSSNGRGAVSIVQEPSAANGYTTIVRVDDSAKGGENRYGFTLKWSAQ